LLLAFSHGKEGLQVLDPRKPDAPREEYRREEYRSTEGPAAPYDRPGHVAPVVTTPSYNYRAVQITWFVVGLIDVLIGLRFVLKLTGASPQAEFVRLMYAISRPFVAPFRGIFPDSGQGFYVFEPSSLVAVAVYLLLGWGIVTLVKILTTPRGARAVD
jgi:uncharacterized protein YggT (Ycf19 family)